jgi:hypothetical protein
MYGPFDRASSSRVWRRVGGSIIGRNRHVAFVSTWLLARDVIDRYRQAFSCKERAAHPANVFAATDSRVTSRRHVGPTADNVRQICSYGARSAYRLYAVSRIEFRAGLGKPLNVFDRDQNRGLEG